MVKLLPTLSNYLSILKLQQWHRWSLRMDKNDHWEFLSQLNTFQKVWPDFDVMIDLMLNTAILMTCKKWILKNDNWLLLRLYDHRNIDNINVIYALGFCWNPLRFMPDSSSKFMGLWICYSCPQSSRAGPRVNIRQDASSWHFSKPRDW